MASLSAIKICVLFPGALGDFLCFLPALHALRQRGPVDLYARSEFHDLVPDGVLLRSLESPEVSVLFQAEGAHPSSHAALWRRYDRIYSWHGSGVRGFVERLKQITRGRARCYPFLPIEPSGHQSEHYLRCVGAAGACEDKDFFIPLREDALRWREKFWHEHGLNARPILTLAPGSGAREKNWPAEFFSLVAAWWRSDIRGEVLLLLGPVERERGGLDHLTGRCIELGQLSLSQVAAVLARSTVYVGNDSGISHMAGALGARTVALFGPSDPLRWSPHGSKVIVLRRGLDCSPCSAAAMKLCSHHSCLRDFSPGEVIRALERLPEVAYLDKVRGRD